MSSFEDIYHKVLIGSNRDTVYERLVYIMTHQRQIVSTILFPFLQVVTDDIYKKWYLLLERDVEPSLSEIITMTNIVVHHSLTHLQVRRVIDLILIKCNSL